MPERYRILEFWRIAAAVAVMLFHFLNYGPPSAVHATDVLFRLLPLMDMFFMISGFLIMERYADRLLTERGSYARFLLRRIARFYPLYLATLAFFVAVSLAIRFGFYETQSPERYDLAALPANLLLIQGWGFTDTLTFNYVGWTLSAEWFCYLTLPVIVLAHRRGGLAGLALPIVASFALLETATAAGLMPFDRWFLADTWGAFRAFADFAIGALVAVAVRRRDVRIESHLPAWLCFGAALGAMAWISASYLVLGLLALSVWLAAVAERNNPAGARFLFVFDPLGRVSFSIYLIHPVVAALMLGGLWRMAIEPTGLISFYVFWFLPMAAVVVLSLASYHWFETPASRWINAIWTGGSGERRPEVVPAETTGTVPEPR